MAVSEHQVLPTKHRSVRRLEAIWYQGRVTRDIDGLCQKMPQKLSVVAAGRCMCATCLDRL